MSKRDIIGWTGEATDNNTASDIDLNAAIGLRGRKKVNTEAANTIRESTNNILSWKSETVVPPARKLDSFRSKGRLVCVTYSIRLHCYT